jgi:hypothetical protein
LLEGRLGPHHHQQEIAEEGKDHQREVVEVVGGLIGQECLWKEREEVAGVAQQSWGVKSVSGAKHGVLWREKELGLCFRFSSLRVAGEGEDRVLWSSLVQGWTSIGEVVAGQLCLVECGWVAPLTLVGN